MGTMSGQLTQAKHTGTYTARHWECTGIQTAAILQHQRLHPAGAKAKAAAPSWGYTTQM